MLSNSERGVNPLPNVTSDLYHGSDAKGGLSQEPTPEIKGETLDSRFDGCNAAANRETVPIYLCESAPRRQRFDVVANSPVGQEQVSAHGR